MYEAVSMMLSRQPQVLNLESWNSRTTFGAGADNSLGLGLGLGLRLESTNRCKGWNKEASENRRDVSWVVKLRGLAVAKTRKG